MTVTAVRRAIACIALVVSAGAAGAQQQHPTRADLNGEWNGPVELEGGTHDVTLVFKLTDSTFVGATYDAGRFFGDMTGGTFVGDTVRFKVDVLAFTGVITGNKMKVAMIVYNGSTRNFVVTKKPADKGGVEPRRE